MRLILLFFFPIGYLLTFQLFENNSAEYLIISTLLFLSCALILFYFKRLRAKNIIIYMLFIIFIFGHFVKFYYLSYYWNDINQLDNFNKLIGNKSMDIVTIPKLFYAFEVISISFILFSVISVFIMRVRWKNPTFIDASGEFINKANGNVFLARKITYLALIIGIITTYVRWKYNLVFLTGVDRLPYNLIAIINVLHSYVSIPLFGLAYIIGLSSGKKNIIRSISVIFIVFCLIQFILSTSKTYLFFPFFFIYFSSLIYEGKSYKNYLLIMGAILFLSIPFLGEYRHSLRVNLNLTTIFWNVFQDKDLFQIYFQSALSIMNRILGFGELIHMIELENIYSKGFVGNLMNPIGAEKILNQEMNTLRTGFAPSLLGQAYFSTGNIFGTALIIILWVVFSSLIFQQLIKNSQNYVSCTISILWLFQVFIMSIDSYGLLKMIFFTISCVALWLVYSVLKFKFYLRK